MEITKEHIKCWINKINEKITENKCYLTKLDQPIGDGDHGVNMERGFQATVNMLETTSYDTVSSMLKACALSVMSKVGGAAGPLYGTAFLRMSLHLNGAQLVTEKMFIEALEEAVVGMKKRGRTEVGEKTMIDVWEPVVEKLQEDGAFHASAIIQTAKEARNKTEHIAASKGRASFFKEKSVGYIDPGAASSYIIFEALAETLEEGACQRG